MKRTIPSINSHAAPVVNGGPAAGPIAGFGAASNGNLLMKPVKILLAMLGLGALLTTVTAHAGRFALVADQNNARVVLFYVNGQTWTYVKNFADTSTPTGDAAPFTKPTAVAQDPQGRIYVSDQTTTAGQNRVLRFDTNGVFLDLVGDATTGLNGFNVPGSGLDDMICGPDGNLYGTVAFGAPGQIWKYVVASNQWTQLVVSNAAVRLNAPRGLDFGPDNNLYVCNRQYGNMLVFDTNGTFLRTNAVFSGTYLTTPMGLRWDPVGSRFICTSGNGGSVVCACTTNGVLSLITAQQPSGDSTKKNILGVLADGTNVFYGSFSSPGHIYLCNNTSTTSVTPVDAGTTPTLSSSLYMNYAVGFGLGSLQSVTLSVTRTNMLAGTVQQAHFTGDYVAQSGVDLSTDPNTVWSSSDPGVLTVSPQGLLTAVGLGSATLSVTNGAFNAATNITVVPLTTTLIHRYSFTSDANDSVGTANGTVSGFSYSYANGQLALAPTSQYDYTYVDFGPSLISGNDALTFEAWASFGTNYNWARLFDFGDNDGINGTAYVALTPHSASGTTRVALKTGAGGEVAVDAPGTLDNKTNVHIVAVVHPLGGTIKLYLNGVLAAQKTNITGQDLAGIVDNYNYLGRSQFYVDPAATESIDEFRVYSGVLDATNVAFHYAAGPDNVVSDPGALQSVSLALNTNMLQQGQQTVLAYGTFANVSGVPLNNFSGVSFTSSDTNVFTVSASGVVRAVGYGTATITVSYGDQSASYAVTSEPLPQTSYLVTDGAGNRVLQYSGVGTNWMLTKVFAAGTYDGLPMTEPIGVVQDPAGNVYVSDGANGGRVLKFAASGDYLGSLGTNGVDYFASPANALTVDAAGSIYMATPFGTNNVMKYDTIAGTWSEFVPTTDGFNYTLVNPTGIAFGPDGNLYVANRGGFNAANRPVHEFDTNGFYLGNLTTGLVGPQGLSWDKVNQRFLFSNGATSIAAISTNGVVTTLAGGVAADAVGTLSSGPFVYYADYSASGIYAITGPSSAVLVAGGITHVHQAIEFAFPPNLSLTVGGGNVVVSWPYSTGTYMLQSCADLGLADWQNVAATPTQVGNSIQVTLPLTGNTRFFRLSN
ncbi:MAG TPA: hypothetical protein VFV96_00480 [Verrucomicrobiae bacterium]|nr:hypothetical protein [Verrucomicrobiae bacterium]